MFIGLTIVFYVFNLQGWFGIIYGIIYLLIAMLTGRYIYTRPFKEFGVKDKETSNDTLVFLYLKWLYKYWHINLIIFLIIIVPVFFIKNPPPKISGGISLIIVAVFFELATNYKIPYITDGPYYRLAKAIGRERLWIIFLYLGSLALFILGLFFLLHGLGLFY